MNNLKLFFLNHWKLIIKLCVAITLLFLIIQGGSGQVKNIDYYETIRLVRTVSFGQIIFLSFLGLLATSVMTLYDFSIIRHFKHEIKPLVFFGIAFVANALNNLLGIGGLAGVATRTILLRKNSLELSVSVYYNVLLSPATPTGLSLMGLWLLLFKPNVTENIMRHYPWLYFGIVGTILILPIYFMMGWLIDRFQKNDFRFVIHRSVWLKLQLISVSLLEWLSAFLFFRHIILFYGFDLDFSVALGIYAISAISGIMSFLPGGIGSFDLIAVIGLQQAGVNASSAFAILLLFRFFYFFIPVFVGVFFLLLNLMMDRNEKLFSYSFLTRLGFFNNVIRYYKTYSDFVNVLLSLLVFSGGLVLLESAVKPGIEGRIALISQLLPPTVLNFFQLASIVISFLLGIVSIEILYKVKRSYSLAVFLLSAGAFFTFLKGLDYEESLFLIAILILIKLSKPSFFRYSMPLRLSKAFFLAALGLVGILFYFVASEKIHVEFIAHSLYPAKLVNIYGNVLYHSSITFGIYLIFLAALYLKKPRIEMDPRFEAPDFARLAKFLEINPGSNFAHLSFMGDKNLFWTSDGRMVIAYKKYKNLIVVLGDPIGDKVYLSAAIQEFQNFLDQYGYEAAFYEVSEKHLSTYHDNGYYFFKLGEEAVVEIERFSMAGAAKANQRNIFNGFRKKGYHFEVMDPPFEKDFLKECREISDEWLGKRREKGFSMGAFIEEYLQQSQIAILRDPGGILIAFVSLMPSYDHKQSMSTDLMRFRNNVPRGTMDYILTSLIFYLKENNYKYFNMGMAPLSNVGMASRSHLREKMANIVYNFGNFFYSFEGLRKYKEKYDPIWMPRYLAYHQLLSLPAVLLEISMLISSRKYTKRKSWSLLAKHEKRQKQNI